MSKDSMRRCPDCRGDDFYALFGGKGNGECKPRDGTGCIYGPGNAVASIGTFGMVENYHTCGTCGGSGQCQTCGGTGYEYYNESYERDDHDEQTTGTQSSSDSYSSYGDYDYLMPGPHHQIQVQLFMARHCRNYYCHCGGRHHFW